MDKLYIGDIPENYKFARFGSNYIDLFDRQTLTNGQFHYYRVYFYDNYFVYTEDNYNVGSYNVVTLQEVPVTNDWHYRRDLDSIYTCVFLVILLITFVFNVLSSMIRKGGVLGGLL